MSRNASGTYTLPSGNPVVTGTLIESSWANTTLSDLASAMTDSLSRSAQGGMTAALRLYDGTSSVPGLAWGSETTTGWYRSGAGDMRLVVTGSEVVKYLSTGVAVTGTLSATGAVSLSGTTMTLENSTAYYPQVINRNKTADANGSYISLQKIRGSSIVQNGDVLGNVIFSGYDGASYLQGAYINAVVSATPGTNDMPADLAFGTTADGGSGPTERLRITQAGNVGVGTSSPSALLNVNYNSASFTTVKISNSVTGNGSTDAFDLVCGTSGEAYVYNRENQPLVFGTNNAERMRIDSSGNVGIGTSSPTTRLSVSSASSVQVQATTGTVDFRIQSIDANSAAYSGTVSNHAYAFTTNNSERARIDTSGNLLVGTTSQVGGNNTIMTLRKGGLSWQLGPVAANGNFLIANASDVGVYIANGNTSWTANSDERLKTALTPFENAAEKVCSLRAGTGRYLTDEETVSRSFLIAQDVQAVLPEAVDASNPDSLGVQYTDVIPLLVAAIKEQQAIITALTARVTALENQP